jgi:hypothetical protein
VKSGALVVAQVLCGCGGDIVEAGGRSAARDETQHQHPFGFPGSRASETRPLQQA